MTNYILDDDNNPIPCEMIEAHRWMEENFTERCKVKREQWCDCEVSTIFLGIDHNWGNKPPLLFETLVFGGYMDGESDRSESWQEAERSHEAMKKRIVLGKYISFHADPRGDILVCNGCGKEFFSFIAEDDDNSVVAHIAEVMESGFNEHFSAIIVGDGAQ